MKTSESKHKTKKKKRTSPHRRYENDYSINGRIWISEKEETFLGYGRVVLLERIKDYGSITKAAKSMGMSYRNAWELVASMNKLSEKPLVDRFTGGKGGGGTILTKHGEKAITLFWKLRSDLLSFFEKRKKELSVLYEKKF
tara:strand:- start:10779 stop:11201 length:423 start_codon:yes stop_codon:yes gene_type:complete